MKIKFLGTGTSHGIPVAGCGCSTCASKDPKDTRYRSSVWITDNEKNIIIDTPAEFRLRTIDYGINSVDAVLLTHTHADHIAGLDDIRRYNEIQGGEIPVYGEVKTLKEVKNRFSYMFKDTQEGGGKPKIDLVEVVPFDPFFAAQTEFTAIPVKHGDIDILGFRTGSFAYLTDVSAIPEESYEYLRGLTILVLDALRKEPHPTHFNLEQAVSEAKKIGAQVTYFTHIAHALKHEEINRQLPNNIKLAHDGLEFVI